jgi:hypothetical protein
MYTDKLGYYAIGNFKVYSKLEAILLSQQTGTHLSWCFNDEAFSKYDWTQEPKTNLLELYADRAQRLRQQYDYIILMYSGGADSETVLQSFLDNDIKLDEVASFVNLEATHSTRHYLNFEIYFNAIQRITELKQKHHWLHHRIVDISQLQLDFFEHGANKFDWIFRTNTFYNSNVIAKENLGLKVPDWANLIHQGKKVCILWGQDKPRVFHDGKFGIRFLDMINGPTVNGMKPNAAYTDELFFWSPDNAELLCKQAHLLKNYLNENLWNSIYVSANTLDLAYKTVADKKYGLSNEGVHSIIYPNWISGTISIHKPSSTIFSPRDDWFNQLRGNAYDNWYMGVDKLWKMLPDYWKNDPQSLASGIKGCWSKPYYLEN